ncbi:hypothetical protein [Flavobacterium hungaricum]|uniref:Lipoprotein n=1 Tax=Flavobacterium hungaricum TaxID=2082725 RepID=A0ABR9TF97_9FLAO|nr:hypothetical protein [Flavobacterium hungaricum]MBE8723549.1 hypothetical protein [Flavobacterium hungaricum]
MKIKTLVLLSVLAVSCQKETKTEIKKTQIVKDSIPISLKHTEIKEEDTIVISKKHKTNKILCDLDGDGLDETVEIVRGLKSNKSGLRIIFGNKKRIDYLGMGKDIVRQGFDEIDWAGIFEKAPKNEVYYNNINKEGEIMGEEEVKEEDLIKLPNDGIFIHAEESCGGGIIYLNNGKYDWIQRE